MIRRIYVHNFRCLENFELRLADQSSVLLIGANGSGKTTVGQVLQIFQLIARGENRVGKLFGPEDFPQYKTTSLIRLEIEADLSGANYKYSIALDLPSAFREFRVHEEKLLVDDRPVYSRQLAQVRMSRAGRDDDAEFGMDWHLLALPIIQPRSEDDSLEIFRRWLSRLIVLRPAPGLISGDSSEKTLFPDPDVSNLGAWFSGLLAHSPKAYNTIEQCMKSLMPDFSEIQNPEVGKDARSLVVHFVDDSKRLDLPFKALSDGEKCFLISALVLAANEVYGPLCCFWDEPDNYLATSEVGHFILSLRSAFNKRGQFIASSHNIEAIRRFSEENTLLLYRRSHLEPTNVRPVSDLGYQGDLADALIRGDVEP